MGYSEFEDELSAEQVSHGTSVDLQWAICYHSAVLAAVAWRTLQRRVGSACRVSPHIMQV